MITPLQSMVKTAMKSQKAKTALAQFLELFWDYFRVEVEGLENIPTNQPTIIAPNHSGCIGIDAVMLSYLFKKKLNKKLCTLADPVLFEAIKTIGLNPSDFGLIKVSVDAGIKLLQSNETLLIFPEGEAGDMKSSLLKYQLQHFHTGFICMAAKTNAVIVPCVVVGAEESNLNVGNINLTKFIKGLRIPMPINLIPLPAKWKIKFLKPINMPTNLPDSLSKEWLNNQATIIKNEIQNQIDVETKSRPYLYFAFETELKKFLPKINK